MILIFFPDYSSSNPYQIGLYKSFFDSDFVGPGTITDAIEAIHLQKGKVFFHLHWQDRLFRSAKNQLDYDKIARKFIDNINIFLGRGGIFLWTIHNRLPHEQRFGIDDVMFHGELSRLATAIHIHDKNSVNYIKRLYHISDEKIFFSPHGNYESFYKLNNFSTENSTNASFFGKFVLFIGHIRPYKGLELLLDAFDIIKHRNIKINLLISGESRNNYAEKTRLFARNNDLVHTKIGFSSAKNMSNMLCAAEAVILPYNDVLTSGISMLAATFGKPVIAPRISTISHIEENGFGILYEPNSAESLALSIENYVNMKEKDKLKMSIAALRTSSNLSWDTISKKFREKLEEF